MTNTNKSRPHRAKKQAAPIYPFSVRPLADTEGGGYLIEFPDLPGCYADGSTVEEAIQHAIDAEKSWLETAKHLKRPVPKPTQTKANIYSGKWVLRTPKSLHRKLAERAKEEGVSLNTLAVNLLSENYGRL